MQFSIWEKEGFFQQQDLIIIGSGLVGLWSAILLKDRYPNIKVTIVERGIIPSGASGRNAGFACFGSVSELIADAEKMGTDKMWDLVEMRYKGLRKLTQRFPVPSIGFESEGGYEVFSDNQLALAEKCMEAIDELNKGMKSITGEDHAFRLNNPRLSEFGFAGFCHLIENRLEAQLHSGKLLQTLIRTAVSAGVQILTGTKITEIIPSGQSVELRASEFTLRATKVLVCTNGFAKELIPDLDVVPARGQVLVTSPIDGLPFKGCFHYDEGFYYFRNLGNRVLLGGGRNLAFKAETTTEMVTSSLIQENLEHLLRTNILPSRTFTVEHRWSGIMGMSEHSGKLPIIRDLGDGVYCCVRMSGMGVALAPEVAVRVTNLLAF
ncbi:MAG TPA: FAD-dependent oxidoreductase [Parasegetibacter sp.]